MNKFLMALCGGVLACAASVVGTPALAAEEMAPATRTIVLVRHGNYVSDPAVNEKIGPHLSPLGVAQAYLAGAALQGLPVHFDHLYSSPMQRARDTAAVIAGNFPGRSFEVVDDMAECTPPTRRSEITKDDKPADLAACKDQLDRVFARFFRPATAGDQADMLVCHGNVTRYLVTRALGVDTAAWLEMSVGHASITTIRINADGSFKVIAVGDVGHMPDNMRTGATGDLAYAPDRFPLFAIKSRDWRDDLPVMLVTGGVHGYETSGVHGALQFVERHAAEYTGKVNLIVAPCVSPWGYERIQRWNADALDPNRNFVDDSPAQEPAALMSLLAPLRDRVLMHVDLHETTDSDESEFRPALAARDGKPFEPGLIPDGFYLVDDSDNPQPDFQQAMIDAVARVTHIAPSDDKGEIIGSEVFAPGVIRYPLRSLGLCAGVTDARYRTTTEVYPDSPRATPQQCNDAQVAAVRAGIDYALASGH